MHLTDRPYSTLIDLLLFVSCHVTFYHHDTPHTTLCTRPSHFSVCNNYIEMLGMGLGATISVHSNGYPQRTSIDKFTVSESMHGMHVLMVNINHARVHARPCLTPKSYTFLWRKSSTFGFIWGMHALLAILPDIPILQISIKSTMISPSPHVSCCVF